MFLFLFYCSQVGKKLFLKNLQVCFCFQIAVRNSKNVRISENIQGFQKMFAISNFCSEFHEMFHFFVITNLVRNLKNDLIPENVQGLQKMFVISIFFRNFMKCSILKFLFTNSKNVRVFKFLFGIS